MDKGEEPYFLQYNGKGGYIQVPGETKKTYVIRPSYHESIIFLELVDKSKLCLLYLVKQSGLNYTGGCWSFKDMKFKGEEEINEPESDLVGTRKKSDLVELIQKYYSFFEKVPLNIALKMEEAYKLAGHSILD